jgi:hypothetical protein
MRQQHHTRQPKTQCQNDPKSKRPEDANRGGPGESPRDAGDPANTSPRDELATKAQNQTDTRTGYILPMNLASSPRDKRPPKVVKRDGGLDFEVDRSSFPTNVHQTFGTTDPDLLSELFLQVNAALPSKRPEEPGQYNSVLAALHGIGPCDPLEGLLVVQMVTGHHLVMDFLKRAALPAQPTAGVDLYVNLATKLQRTFVQQVEALGRHRDRQRQKTGLAQVHVHGEAQAIVSEHSHQGSREVSGEDCGNSA